MDIRCLTLDWGDTLAASCGMPHLGAQRIAFAGLERDLIAAGCTPDGDWLTGMRDEFTDAWHHSADPVRNPEHREYDFLAILDRHVAKAGAIGAEPAAVRRAIDRCLTILTETVVPYGTSANVLSLLKARGFRLGILSHVPLPGEACRAWFLRHGLAPYIDFYSLSCEVGWIKPSPRHFRHALDAAGCAPGHILHVGDHPVRDIQGAAAMGMRTCLRLTEHLHDPTAMAACRPDITILHLGDLPTALAHLQAQAAEKAGRR
jgi:FMN phosphatase YigB (HAD superfamily)